ncbi:MULTISPECIES: hypothetical protein [Nonomuraea]|uniref:Ankyrin repeat domain-containing protein n=1 Tax=Nonomuraea mangrovi TaxID=2316207 RepID=A0ABW4T2L0_9ACTN
MDSGELETLPTIELHERAVHYAVRHGDFAFIWDLLKAIPAAEAASGHGGEVVNDLSHLSALLSDAMASGHGDLGEALKPLYVDYLSKHPEA